MVTRGTTIGERITALEVTVGANKTELNQKIDTNQKCLIDKIDLCYTAINNHLEHAAEEIRETKNRNWTLIISLMAAVAPYVAYGIWMIINHIVLGHPFFGI